MPLPSTVSMKDGQTASAVMMANSVGIILQNAATNQQMGQQVVLASLAVSEAAVAKALEKALQ